MRFSIVCLLILIIAMWFLPVGDVNFDGRLNSADLNVIWHGDLNPIQRIVADINRDHRVDRKDLDILFDIVLGRR